MEKQLKDLIAAIDAKRVVGSLDKRIVEVTNDSRQAREGSLFIAVRGAVVDAHQFIPAVVAAGAAAVVCEELPATLDEAVTYVQVPNSTQAEALLADAWYDHPSSQLKLVGVTGTNGKTTTATLLYEMARLMGYKAGLLSTVKTWSTAPSILPSRPRRAALKSTASCTRWCRRAATTPSWR